MAMTGQVIRYFDNVDTDVIIPARYLNSTDPKELAAHCMEDLDPTFVARVKPGDIIVAGENFGCGSSREHAPVAIKASGIACVVAKSFARIFYRNAVNIGLSIVECDVEAEDGDRLSVDFDKGVIKNLSRSTEARFAAFPPFLQTLLNAGGLLNAVKEGKL